MDKNINNLTNLKTLWIINTLIWIKRLNMKTSSIKISKNLLEKLKKLKEFEGVSTYEDLIESIVEEKIRKIYAITYSDYLPVGTVVEIENRVAVIKDIKQDKVIFNDGFWVFNESVACKEIKKLADSVKEFKGVVKC